MVKDGQRHPREQFPVARHAPAHYSTGVFGKRPKVDSIFHVFKKSTGNCSRIKASSGVLEKNRLRTKVDSPQEKVDREFSKWIQRIFVNWKLKMEHFLRGKKMVFGVKKRRKSQLEICRNCEQKSILKKREKRRFKNVAKVLEKRTQKRPSARSH